MAIIENKRDIKYIQILPASTEGPTENIGEVFITKKFTQYRTSRTLKIYVFEIPDNKNTGKLWSKYELRFLDQVNSSSNLCQILILQFPIPRALLASSPSLSNFTHTNWNPSSTQSSSCSSLVSLFCFTPFSDVSP